MYNTNPDFDDGVFDTLKTKILNAGLDITSFAYTFTKEGVFVFGDYSDPNGFQTIVYVNNTLYTEYEDSNIFPLTAENLELLGISSQDPVMRQLGDFLWLWFALWIICGGGLHYAMIYYEWWVENVKEYDAVRRDKNNRMWKTTEGEVNKLEYLSDLYKILEENLREVQKRIKLSKDRESLYKLLNDKTSIMKELRDGGANVVIIRDELKKMLGNLRF